MSQPDVSPTALDLYDSLGAYRQGDEDTGWQLLLACEAIATAFTEPIAELVAERDGRVPWEILFDPENCPVAYLPYLAQFTGSTLTSSMSEAEMRAAIVLPEGFRRGTPDALIAAVKRTLTGGQTVHLDERWGGEAYQLRVRTLASETPDPAATEAAILTQKPIGIVLTYGAITGQDWADLAADHATWADVVADYGTWAEVPLDLP